MSEVAAPRRRAWPRISPGAVATFFVGSLLLAGAVHICAILLVPAFARADGWSRLAPLAGDEEFVEIRTIGAGAASLPGLDPLFVNAACRLHLAGSPVAIAVQGRNRFWSLALYDPQGMIVFSLNDRTAVDGGLDMLVINPAHSVEIKQSPPPGIDQMIVVEGEADDMVALLRLFAPTEAAREEARRALAQTECLPFPFGGAE